MKSALFALSFFSSSTQAQTLEGAAAHAPLSCLTGSGAAGETALSNGRVKDALEQFTALRISHKDEAIHALQLARTLLAAGAGEAARAEALRGTELAPGSFDAYRQLAEILTHDMFGRPMQFGFDRDGAEAAYRKALELDPQHLDTRLRLAELLEHDGTGVRYGAGAKIGEALVEYEKLKNDLGRMGASVQYSIILIRNRRYPEARDYLTAQPDSAENRALIVCADTMLSGSRAAITHAKEKWAVDLRSQAITTAGYLLISMREYATAADLLEAVNIPANGQLAELTRTLRGTRRITLGTVELKQPQDSVQAFYEWAALSADDTRTPSELFSRWAAEISRPSAMDDFRGSVRLRLPKQPNLSKEVRADIWLSQAQYSVEGDDDSGWVITASLPSAPTQTWFVVKENGSYRLLGITRNFTAVARMVLGLADSGELETARTWLNRVRELTPTPTPTGDRINGFFARTWETREKLVRVDLIRQAAAILLIWDREDVSSVIRILVSNRNGADTLKTAVITGALADAYVLGGEHGKAFDTVQALLETMPDSLTALVTTLRAAYGVGKLEADQVLDAHLERFRDSADAMRSVASMAMSQGDAQRSNAILRELIDSGRGQSNDYNNIAWGDLMAGNVSATTLEYAQKGAASRSRATLQTLALVYAELGKTSEARTTLLQSLAPELPLSDSAAYAFARIVEAYGLKQEAAAMYRKLAKPPHEWLIPSSNYALAQHRLRVILAAERP
jgi:tetratricopeptide (TPR) repeat protein